MHHLFADYGGEGNAHPTQPHSAKYIFGDFLYDRHFLRTHAHDAAPSVSDEKNLIMSDGTSSLSFLDPDSLKLLNVINVTDNNGPVGNINELEYINGNIYANQWLAPYILKIDPASGKVLGRMDFTQMIAQVKNQYSVAEEFNGIAYDSTTQKVFVTGKKWPKLYEIKIL